MSAESFSRAVAFSAILVGCVAVLGWVLNIEPLRNVYHGLPSTTMNEAVATVLIGTALWLVVGTRRRRPAVLVSSVLVLAISLVTLAEHSFQWPHGIDELVIHQVDDSVRGSSPGRMSPQTALAFLLLSSALLLLCSFNSATLSYVADAFCLLASLIGQITCLAYMAGASNVYQSGSYGAISAETAVMLTALGFGILCAYTNRGLMLVLASPNAGGIVARRLLPLGIGFLPLLILLTSIARFAGLNNSQLGGFIILVVAVLLVAAPILWTSILLYQTDNRRLQAERQLEAQYHVVESLNEDLQRQTKQLQAANKELETFSYSVSHDLRAPLRHIVGYMSLLENRLQTSMDAESKRYLAASLTAANRLGTLIDDLLSFSRMGRTEMLEAPIDMESLVHDVIQEVSLNFGERNVQWIVGSFPPLRGDPAMIRLVLVNYMSNALKFTKTRPVARIEVGALSNANEIAVFVRDNGVGFDMRYLPKLFGVFQRLHRNEDFDGTGIGLATARRIIERHGGRTWAESSVDQGATFFFSLPGREQQVA